MRTASRWWAAVAVVLSTSVAAAQPSAGKNAATLPLGKVRLYETGVAYFERSGAVQGGGVHLPVPAGHLDDALKTLVVLGQDGEAAVDGIAFKSRVSRGMGLALAGLSEGGGGAVDYMRLLEGLEGAAVEVRTAKGLVKGRLVDVEAPPAEGNRVCAEVEGKEVCRVTRHHQLVVLTDGGEIRRLSEPEVTSVKPSDPGWQKRLGSALDAVSQRGLQNSRDLEVLAKSGKPVTLGYIAEAPVWRSTYRLVLAPEGEKDALQGWALLHNDTDEDWAKVKVELVNGRPDSFLFPLAAPRYAHRQLVTPKEPLTTIPQLVDDTVDNMWGDAIGEAFGAGGLGLSGIGEGGGGRGEGIGLGSIGTIGHGAGSSGEATSDLLEVGNLAALEPAEGVENGAVFRYSLPKRIDLSAHSSALLPFVSERVEVTSIAYVPSPGATARTAVHLRNSTAQTLPAGPLAVFADGGFAGETGLSRTKPGESRLLAFGLDLDLELEQVEETSRDLPKHVLREGDQLVVHFLREHDVVLGITNKSGRGRKVYLPLAYAKSADVSGVDALAYDEEQHQPLAVFDVQAKHRGRRSLKVREGLMERHPIGPELGPVLDRLVKSPSLATEQRGILRKASERLAQAKKLEAAAKTLAGQIDDLADRRDRLRTDLQALRHQEDRAEDLGEELVRLREQESKAKGKMLDATKRAAELEKRALRALDALVPPSK
ncbi:MAG: hypothetical protein KC731_25340 [Myxococcales bacterium]|nr:hypothetical protein [Myxococcales bacterium]